MKKLLAGFVLLLTPISLHAAYFEGGVDQTSGSNGYSGTSGYAQFAFNKGLYFKPRFNIMQTNQSSTKYGSYFARVGYDQFGFIGDEQLLHLGLDALGHGVELERVHQAAAVGTRPEDRRLERQHLDLGLAEGLAWSFPKDADRFLALQQKVPASSGERLGPHHLGQAPDLEDGGGFPQRAGLGVLPHQGDHQMLVGVEHLDGQFLVARLKHLQGQEGLRKQHDLGQGKERENGW